MNNFKVDTQALIDGILAGNRVMLSRAITIVESTNIRHKEQAGKIVEACFPHSGNSIRIGITGIPGVGKSTFIEQFGLTLTKAGRNIAVLAIDPSSEKSKGSILGDKTRMEILANNPKAYIRPSPSGGTLGGVALKTRETIQLCEAAGFDTILVETVGVGQSETMVHSMTDFFLLLMIAGAGDELQGIKRGVMEMADCLLINKVESDNIAKAKIAAQMYKNSLHLFPPSESNWITPVLMCSALENKGINEVWQCIQKYCALTTANGYFYKNRMDQQAYWFKENLLQLLYQDFYTNPGINENLALYQTFVKEGKMSSFAAANSLLSKYLK